MTTTATAWAVGRPQSSTHVKAVFRSVEAAEDYARYLNWKYQTETWQVMPWTVEAEIFDYDG